MIWWFRFSVVVLEEIRRVKFGIYFEVELINRVVWWDLRLKVKVIRFVYSIIRLWNNEVKDFFLFLVWVIEIIDCYILR